MYELRTAQPRTADVDGLSDFYREAGDPSSPKLLVLGGKVYKIGGKAWDVFSGSADGRLGRLAVYSSVQRSGLGKRMLLRAMKQTLIASMDVGIYALVVNAIDDAAKEWYLGLDWGFEQLLDDPNHLYISIKTLKQLEF